MTTFTLYLEVKDERSLRRAAYKRAQDEGLNATSYARIRLSHPGGVVSSDLIMLLDPGSLPGCEIHETAVEE
jgi:hypothetical protein